MQSINTVNYLFTDMDTFPQFTWSTQLMPITSRCPPCAFAIKGHTVWPAHTYFILANYRPRITWQWPLTICSVTRLSSMSGSTTVSITMPFLHRFLHPLANMPKISESSGHRTTPAKPIST